MNNIVNHIAILLDESSSMNGLVSGVIKQYNNQAKQIAQKAEEMDQKTHLSLYTFASDAQQPILVEVPMDLVVLKDLTKKTYVPNGSTAMLDSIGLCITQLSQFERGTNDSFLVLVITDGEENTSSKYGWSYVSKMIKDKIATDYWTFCFLVPKGKKQRLVSRLEVYDGNVEEWDQTDRGVEEYSKKTQVGINSYFTARSIGKRSVTSFFTDLSSVSTTEVSKALDDVTKDFQRYFVSRGFTTCKNADGLDCAVINEFFEKLNGYPYEIGKAYYELVKREQIQDHKDMVIEELLTGKLFGGLGARRMLGLPAVGTISVKPGDHGKFRIYVKSTSINRKLPYGTRALYKRT